MQPGHQYDIFPDLPVTGVKRSKRKPANLERNKVNHEIAKDRYYHHRRLDKDLFDYDGDKRIITCKFPCSSLDDIPEGKRRYAGRATGQRYHINELIKLGYNVQFKAVNVPAKELVPEPTGDEFKENWQDMGEREQWLVIETFAYNGAKGRSTMTRIFNLAKPFIIWHSLERRGFRIAQESKDLLAMLVKAYYGQ